MSTQEQNQQLVRQREQYKVWLGRQQAAGRSLLGYATPCCGTIHHTPHPAEGERQWDSLSVCMGCGTMFMKIVTHDKVQLLTPEAVG